MYPECEWLAVDVPVVVVIDGLMVVLVRAGDKNDVKSFVFCRLEGRESDKASSKEVSVS